MKIKYVRRISWLSLSFLWAVFGMGCNGDLGDHDFQDPVPSSDQVSKTVQVSVFSKISNAVYAPAKIQHLAQSGGVMYLAGTNGMDLWSWKVSEGDKPEAWTKATDFSDVPADSAQVSIDRLSPIKGGVAVGVAAKPNKDRAAVCGFFGQEEKARWATGFDVPGKKVIGDMTGVADRWLFVSFVNAFTSPVIWIDLSSPKDMSLGYENDVSVLQFGDKKSLNHPVGATAALPDGRIVLGLPNGLLTVQKSQIDSPSELKGVGSISYMEQANPNARLDPLHDDQFKINGKQPTRVGAMRVVGDHLLITFVDDGSGNGGMKAAKINKAEPNKLNFDITFDKPNSKVTRIVAEGLQVRLISEDAIYAFRDGEFSEEFNSNPSTNKAVISKGFAGADPAATLDTFMSGVDGNLPADGVKFWDAAPYGGDWYYATSKGLYKVETKAETRRFHKKTKKAL